MREGPPKPYGKPFSIWRSFLIAVQAVFPILWMASGSLKTSAEMYTNIWGPPGLPNSAIIRTLD